MNLDIVSDVHFEFMKEHHQENFWNQLDMHCERFAPADALILAGDICQLAPANLENLGHNVALRFAERYEKVFYTPGNHESYGGTPRAVDDTIRSWSIPNLTLLQPGVIETYKGRRFLGGTLWYDNSNPEWPGIADHRYVRDLSQVYGQNARFQVEVLPKVQKGDIVVTHHAPTPRSIHSMYEGVDSNCFFVFDCEETIRSAKPALWIHGHMHHGFDLTVGDTRVYCNPHGYRNEGANPKFFSRIRINVKD